MTKRGIYHAAGVMASVVPLLCGCGSVGPQLSATVNATRPAYESAHNRDDQAEVAASGAEHRRVQYASLEPASGATADGLSGEPASQPVDKARQNTASPVADRPVHLTVTKATPVRSLLEMRHHDVIIQSWDLSCGAAALATLLRYEWGDQVTEKQVAQGLMTRKEYIQHPNIVQIREGFSLLDLKHYVDAHGFKGEGFGQLDFDDLIEKAPIMVPIDALGYNHFVIFRGVMGNRVLLADPAWGNRTMPIDKFKRMWLDYGKAMGHVGFVVERSGVAPVTRMQPQPGEFVTFD